MQKETKGHPDRRNEVTPVMKREDSLTRDHVLSEMEEPKSKTRRKKEMIELQKLGERLVELPGSYVKRSGIPQELLEAVISMKNMRTHEARRRHMQHIGVLMREVDPAQIRRVLNEYSQPRQTRAAGATTDMDEPVLALMGGTAEHMEDLMKRCPYADRTRLRQLVRNAKAEADQGGKTRALTALKSYLAELLKS